RTASTRSHFNIWGILYLPSSVAADPKQVIQPNLRLLISTALFLFLFFASLFQVFLVWVAFLAGLAVLMGSRAALVSAFLTITCGLLAASQFAGLLFGREGRDEHQTQGTDQRDDGSKSFHTTAFICNHFFVS